MDAGYDFGRIDPKYYDRLRTSALPARAGEFGRDGQVFFSVRQTRAGLRTAHPTTAGELRTLVEVDFIGSGADAGKMTPRVRHLWGEIGAFGAGQTWSPFTDQATEPISVESFRPIGMVLVRNIQLRWTPLRGPTTLQFAIEKPGASGEAGDYEELVAAEDVQIRYRTPEWVVAVQREGDWGHVRAAGLLRRIWWDDLTDDDVVDLSGDATGWGANLTSVVNLSGKDKLKLQYLFGAGIENYVNDGTPDLAPVPNPADPSRPITFEALPMRAFTAYAEFFRGKWAFVAGASAQYIDNAEGQSADAYASGRYATGSLLYYPVTNLMLGVEYQYGSRSNFEDGWDYADSRLQVAVRYGFSVGLTR